MPLSKQKKRKGMDMRLTKANLEKFTVIETRTGRGGVNTESVRFNKKVFFCIDVRVSPKRSNFLKIEVDIWKNGHTLSPRHAEYLASAELEGPKEFCLCDLNPNVLRGLSANQILRYSKKWSGPSIGFIGMLERVISHRIAESSFLRVNRIPQRGNPLLSMDLRCFGKLFTGSYQCTDSTGRDIVRDI